MPIVDRAQKSRPCLLDRHNNLYLSMIIDDASRQKWNNHFTDFQWTQQVFTQRQIITTFRTINWKCNVNRKTVASWSSVRIRYLLSFAFPFSFHLRALLATTWLLHFWIYLNVCIRSSESCFSHQKLFHSGKKYDLLFNTMFVGGFYFVFVSLSASFG